MSVTTIASSIYNQYQGVIDKLKTGSTTAVDALEMHREMFPQVRGLTVAVSRGYDETALVNRSEIPTGMIEKMQEILSSSRADPGNAARAYQKAGGEQASGSKAVIVTPKGAKTSEILGPLWLPDDVVANMAPAEREAREAELKAFVTGKMEHMVGEMNKFAPHIPELEAAGLTIDDMARAHVYRRGGDADYSVEVLGGGSNEKSAAIETFINSNPEVRTLYDKKWSRSGD